MKTAKEYEDLSIKIQQLALHFSRQFSKKELITLESANEEMADFFDKWGMKIVFPLLLNITSGLLAKSKRRSKNRELESQLG